MAGVRHATVVSLLRHTLEYSTYSCGRWTDKGSPGPHPLELRSTIKGSQRLLCPPFQADRSLGKRPSLGEYTYYELCAIK